MRQHNFRRRFGFTLVELLIAIAVLAIVLTLAAPSFREMIQMQRMKSIAAQVVTDVQFARAEAASRQRLVYITFGSAQAPNALTCYVIHTCQSNDNSGCACNCANAGNSCVANVGDVEIRKVQVPATLGVRVGLTPAVIQLPSFVSFDPATGGMPSLSVNPLTGATVWPDPVWVDTSLTRANPPILRTRIPTSGRPSLCSTGTAIAGFTPC